MKCSHFADYTRRLGLHIALMATFLAVPSYAYGAVFQNVLLKAGIFIFPARQTHEPFHVTAFHSLAEFRRVGGFSNYSTDVVVAPGAREVAAFAFGLSRQNSGEGLVGAAGCVLDAKGEPTPGALFQAVQLGDAAPVESNSKLSVGDVFFLPHGEGFLFGDWGRSEVGSRRVRRGAVCVLLDEGNGPLEFWAMDSLDGPKALKVQPPEGGWEIPMSFLGFPEGGLCAWSSGEDDGVRIAIILAKVVAGVTEYSLFAWSQGRWSSNSLFKTDGREFRALGVLKVELRLAWVQDRFEALVSLAEPSKPARLKRFNWELGLIDLATPEPRAELKNRDSFHIAPNGLNEPGPDQGKPFTVIHCKGPGFANQDFLVEASTEFSELLSVSLGSSASVSAWQVRIPSYPSGQSGRIGHRVHSALMWNEAGGPVRGSLSGTTHLGAWSGSLKPELNKWRMPVIRRLPYKSVQFLGSYSIVRTEAIWSLLVAPNLFYGQIREGPSRDPLTWVRIDHVKGDVTMGSLSAAQFISSNARWVE